MKFYYTYVLQSEIVDKRYIGLTDNLESRLKSHNAGKVKSTKIYKPWKIIYYEAYLEKRSALRAERFYKTGQGRRQLNKKLEE